MAHFQVPDDRKLEDTSSGLRPWPNSPVGYRLFVEGNGGGERIGVQQGEELELQLTAGKNLSIETTQAQVARNIARHSNQNPAEVLKRNPGPVSVSQPVAASDKHKFKLKAVSAGETFLNAWDGTNNKATLRVVVGNFENDPGMEVDRIARVCRGNDPLKIHALQRMLSNNNTHMNANGETPNGDNIFEQNAPSNFHAKFGNMTCGLVAKFRSDQVFENIATVTDDWYKAAIHEPLKGRISTRSDIKYKPEKVESLRKAIVAALNEKPPKAVRVGVLDNPKRMTPRNNGTFVAYDEGGHTVLIVGCDKSGTKFMYIDPWGGGSKLEYKGGIAGNKFPVACRHLGILEVTHDPARRLKASDTRPNIIQQSALTQGSFSFANGYFLEVIAAPLKLH